MADDGNLPLRIEGFSQPGSYEFWIHGGPQPVEISVQRERVQATLRRGRRTARARARNPQLRSRAHARSEHRYPDATPHDRRGVNTATDRFATADAEPFGQGQGCRSGCDLLGRGRDTHWHNRRRSCCRNDGHDSAGVDGRARSPSGRFAIRRIGVQRLDTTTMSDSQRPPWYARAFELFKQGLDSDSAYLISVSELRDRTRQQPSESNVDDTHKTNT